MTQLKFILGLSSKGARKHPRHPAVIARARRRRKLVLWVIAGCLIAPLFIQFSQPAPRPLSSLDNGSSKTASAQLATTPAVTLPSMR
jgi:hypothetical protein